MSNSQIFKKSKNEDEDVNSIELKNELGALHTKLAQKKKEYKQLGASFDTEDSLNGGAKKKKSKKSSKKSSKKTSKKSSKKSSKKGSKQARSMGLELMNLDVMEGGAKKRKSKKSSKSSKSSSKKSSKKSSQKRSLPPQIVSSNAINEKIAKSTGVERSSWFGIIKFASNIRQEANKSIKDPKKDWEQRDKKMLELIESYISKHGKEKVVKEINALAEEAKRKRSKK